MDLSGRLSSLTSLYPLGSLPGVHVVTGSALQRSLFVELFKFTKPNPYLKERARLREFEKLDKRGTLEARTCDNVKFECRRVVEETDDSRAFQNYRSEAQKIFEMFIEPSVYFLQIPFEFLLCVHRIPRIPLGYL